MYIVRIFTAENTTILIVCVRFVHQRKVHFRGVVSWVSAVQNREAFFI